MPRTRPSRERTFTETDTRGYIYVMTNPAWPGHVKIGSAGDCNKRLAQFNTGSPYRDYEIHYHIYATNRLLSERLVHEQLRDYRAQGEWFRASLWQAVEAMHVLGQLDPNQPTSEDTP